MANVFHFNFDFKYRSSHNKGLKFCRYIDDLIICNKHIQHYLNKIYPDCLNLNKAYEINKYVNFIDLDLIIMNNFFNINLYDKCNFF